jgi:hypothetical protein
VAWGVLLRVGQTAVLLDEGPVVFSGTGVQKVGDVVQLTSRPPWPSVDDEKGSRKRTSSIVDGDSG